MKNQHRSTIRNVIQYFLQKIYYKRRWGDENSLNGSECGQPLPEAGCDNPYCKSLWCWAVRQSPMYRLKYSHSLNRRESGRKL